MFLGDGPGVMAEFEDGPPAEAHTSAGESRCAGLPLLRRRLVRVKPPLPEEREQIERRAQEAKQVDGLMTAASRVSTR